MHFLKFFTGFSRARTVALGAILFVIVSNLIDTGFSMKMVYGAAGGLFYFWLMFKLNLGQIPIVICAMFLLLIFIMLGWDLQEIHRSYYSGFLLGGFFALICHDFRVWMNHDDKKQNNADHH